jgi:hypothetical protein
VHCHGWYHARTFFYSLTTIHALFRHINTILPLVAEPQGYNFNGEPLKKGYVLVHDFNVGRGYGAYFRTDAQILGVMEMSDGSCKCHDSLFFCVCICFLHNTNQNSACALVEALELTQDERTYTALSQATTRTTFLLWSQDTKNKKDWDIYREAAGKKFAKAHRK